MNTTTKAELFSALQELADKYPHWRVGQLLANVAGWADTDVWDAEDDQLLGATVSHLRKSQNQVAQVFPAAAPAAALESVP